jgi:hypothetical protein
MQFIKAILLLIFVCLLTVVTQVGGVVLLISLFLFAFIDKRIKNPLVRIATKVFSFIALYLTFVFVIVPLAAKPFGRVPLPIFENRFLRPGTIWTGLLNRHYVKPELRDIAYQVAEGMRNKYPGSTVNYLDANFPFIDGYPLLPHLSHNDGKKLDLSFQYNDNQTGKLTTDIPSFIGYGICEEPEEGEVDTPENCEKKGFWQYSILRKIVSQHSKEMFDLDDERTKSLLMGFASNTGIGKIFIEPHLKTRWGLTNSKIKFHGCQAVRHDDHIHIQLN